MKELYFDLSMGAAGDMISAALLDLSEDRENIVRSLNELNIPGIKYELEKNLTCGISGSKLKVSYYGAEEEVKETEHRHHHHHHSLKDIEKLIAQLNMSDELKNEVSDIYRIIAEAEARVHNSDMENIHFHELGTMDALADISAAVYIMDSLGPKHVSAGELALGYGKIRCAHGIMPVPAPATALIVKDLPVYGGDVEGELCTPTGAALVKHYVKDFGRLPMMKIESVGYGIGSRVFADRANVVRVFLGEKILSCRQI